MIKIDWLVTELQVTGGAERYIEMMVPLLRSRGWDVRVITLMRGGALVDSLRLKGVTVVELGAQHKADMGAIFRLIRLWKKDPPDLLHTHLYHAGIVGRIVGRLMGIPAIVVHRHGVEHDRSLLRSLIDRWTSGLPDLYVSTCKAVKNVLQEREAVPASRVKVIYNGVQIPQFHTNKFPDDWLVPDGSLVIGLVGRLSQEKGHKLLMEAFSILLGDFPTLYAVFIGRGPLDSKLKELAVELGISKRISWINHSNNVAEWLDHMDIFVLPSSWEGVSLALLEAMGARLPVVATNVGGTPEVVVDGETGILVP
ncbi:MAG: glycosyltransferase, partial [Anaerolineales bacterium]|nr:glycosyltransferase [Anaerolineales bacterium]